MKMEDIRSDLGEDFIEQITNDFITSKTSEANLYGFTPDKLRAKIDKIRSENYLAIHLELEVSYVFLIFDFLKKHLGNAEKVRDRYREIDEIQQSIIDDTFKMLESYEKKSKAIAKKGGQAKATKTEKCRNEFLRLVDERKPPFDKSKVGLAEAVLELKPLIVKYAKENQSSVITASTNLPVKWLNQHWNLPKRSYKKT